MDDNRYCNQLLARLEALLYHELSDCASWKTELVGVDFIQAGDPGGANEDELIRACIARIKAAGIAKEVDYSISGKGILLRLAVRGCRHLEKEALLRREGVKPYNCVLANMICDRLIEKLGYSTTYVARLDVDEAAGRCKAMVAIYATPQKIGEVSDWNAEEEAAVAHQ
jgi:hypothetical protein